MLSILLRRSLELLELLTSGGSVPVVFTGVRRPPERRCQRSLVHWW